MEPHAEIQGEYVELDEKRARGKMVKNVNICKRDRGRWALTGVGNRRPES